jgi:hypothetical protein
MGVTERPETFHIDLTGGNGTPFRFVFWPEVKTVRYYSRRHTLTEGEPGYGINHTNENGQACGPALSFTDFVPLCNYGIRGWHEVDAWDVDGETMRMVGLWLTHIAKAYGLDLS